jgi:cytosine permease
MKKKSNIDILMIMFGFTFFSGSMLIGQKLSSGVNISDFLFCILIGGAILGIFGGMLGYIGAKTGKNMKDLSHMSFGKKGSYLPSLLVGITQIGWYGVGISMFAVPVANLIFPNNIIALYSLIVLFGAFMTISTFIGIKSIIKISYIAVIIILLFGITSIIYAANRQPIDIINSFGNGDKINILMGLQMVIGSYISGAITTPNFSRYGRNPKFIAIICFCAFLLGNGLMIIFGATSNVLVGGNDIFNIFTYFGFEVIGIIVLGLNIWSSCDNGLYSAGLEFENILKIDHKKIILFAGLASTIFSYYLYNNFIDFLSIMNYALPPIGVVLIINYFMKKDYSTNNINVINCIAVIVGGISAYFLKFGISSINAIIVTSLITIVGNCINNKIINKGGNSSYENK